MVTQDTLHLPPMISYAQNFEDVMLRRALADVERGFYVDIGAFDPVADSVTKWFYDCGWQGINIEPNPRFFARLASTRIHDTNLNVAISDRAGEVELMLLDGLSTIDPIIAEQHAQDGIAVGPSVIVETRPLSDILIDYVGDRIIDFLKIDVEGLEGAIIRSTDFLLFRPRVMVVESTLPNRMDQTWSEWEDHLLACDYLFAYFDGLNRFYVRREDDWRMRHFLLPPNVFDRFGLPASSDRVTFARGDDGAFPGVPRSGVGGLLDQRDDLARALAAKAAEVAREETRAKAAQAVVSRLTDAVADVLRGYTSLVGGGVALIEASNKPLLSDVAGVHAETENNTGAARDTTASIEWSVDDERTAADARKRNEALCLALARQDENARRVMSERDGLREDLRETTSRLSADITRYFAEVQRVEAERAAEVERVETQRAAEVERVKAHWAAEDVRHREMLQAANASIEELEGTMTTVATVVDSLRASAVEAEHERQQMASALEKLRGELETARTETGVLDQTLRSHAIAHEKTRDALTHMAARADDLGLELLEMVKVRDQLVVDLWRHRISGERAAAGKLTADADLAHTKAELASTNTTLADLLADIDGAAQTPVRAQQINRARNRLDTLRADSARLRSIEDSFAWRLLHPFTRPSDVSHAHQSHHG